MGFKGLEEKKVPGTLKVCNWTEEHKAPYLRKSC